MFKLTPSILTPEKRLLSPDQEDRRSRCSRRSWPTRRVAGPRSARHDAERRVLRYRLKGEGSNYRNLGRRELGIHAEVNQEGVVILAEEAETSAKRSIAHCAEESLRQSAAGLPGSALFRSRKKSKNINAISSVRKRTVLELLDFDKLSHCHTNPTPTHHKPKPPPTSQPRFTQDTRRIQLRWEEIKGFLAFDIVADRELSSLV